MNVVYIKAYSNLFSCTKALSKNMHAFFFSHAPKEKQTNVLTIRNGRRVFLTWKGTKQLKNMWYEEFLVFFTFIIL
jgi:hypothetical protein